MSLVRRLLGPMLFVFSLVAVAVQATAQIAAFEGKRIAAIQFVPEEQPLEASDIHRILPLKSGEPLTAESVDASIDRLFATGCYADIQVDAEAQGDEVIVRFLTRQSWFTGHVFVTGAVSSPPNAVELTNAAQLDLGQPYTAKNLDSALENQRRLLESNGLYDSSIQPVLRWNNEHQQVEVHFEIASGRRARFTRPVLNGDLQMPAERIIKATRFQRWIIHTWKPATDARLREGLDGIRALYQKQSRLEAKVSVESATHNAAANTVQPTLQIDAGPRIRIQTTGGKVSGRKLSEYIPVFEEHAIDNDLLEEGAHNLQDYFQSQGYFDAEVRVEPQTVAGGVATINYEIARGPAYKLVRIDITGNRYFSADIIRERLFLRTATFLQFPRGRYSRSLLSRDEEAIANLYQSNGFRDVTVSHSIRDGYEGKAGDMAITIAIDEGPQYFIGKLEVEGIEHLDKAKVAAQLSSIAGQPFSEFSVAVDRDAILAQYFEKGFPNATFEWSSMPAAKPHSIDLRYAIHEGSQQFVRQVLFNPDGLRHTRPSLVYRNLQLNSGDPLSPTAITDTQRKLYDLGIFAQVDTAIQDPDGEIDDKYVLFDLEEGSRYSFSWGVGAEFARIGGCDYCLDAPAGQTGFSPRFSFGVTRENLWGIAHTISLRTRISTLEQQGLLTYNWPRFRGNGNLTVSFTGLYEASRDVRTFNYKREEGSMQLQQLVGKTLTFHYRYTNRRVSVSDLKITPELVPFLSQPVRLGLLEGDLIQDRRDDPVDPHRGIYNTVNLGLAEHFLGSQRDYVKVLFRNATYHPLGKRFVLARSTQFGEIYSFENSGNAVDAIPLPERFLSGGDASDRGFPEYQAGPRDTETGFPIGGTALFFNQTELRFPLIGENIGAVLFHDFGNTFSSLGNFSFRVHQHGEQDFDYMVHAVGFGVRYRTPVGPLRADFAYSINPPTFFGFSGTEQELVNAGVNPCSSTPNYCTTQSVSHFQFFFSIGQTF
ncbi:MAG: POTRA domain-containing protein [Bryobacteraceae bacterium]